ERIGGKRFRIARNIKEKIPRRALTAQSRLFRAQPFSYRKSALSRVRHLPGHRYPGEQRGPKLICRDACFSARPTDAYAERCLSNGHSDCRTWPQEAAAP